MVEDDKSLVDDFENLQKSKKEIEEKIELIRKKLINISIQKNMMFIHGSSKICSVKEYSKVIYPEDKAFLLKLIKEKGLYEKYSSINYFKLSPSIIKGEADKDIISLIKKEKGFRISLLNKN